MNSSIPTPFTLTSTTRDVLAELLRRYQTGGPGLAQARLTLESLADSGCAGAGQERSFTFLQGETPISLDTFLAPMTREQAGRFFDELFHDAVPHYASQAQFLQDLRDGRTRSCTPIARNGMLDAVLDLTDANPAITASHVLEALTWNDDQVRTITNRSTIELGKPRRP